MLYPLVPDTLLLPCGTYRRVKRLLDVAAASVLVLLLLPLLGVVAVLIRMTSPGPVLFRQQRIAQGGHPFTMYKFRSMVVDADPRVHEEAVQRYMVGLPLTEDSRCTPYKLVRDPRVTPLGALLRKTSLDELPQLFNVLRGDMSLVGPRPAVPYEVQRYTAAEARRLAVPQGMTGLWQVKGRSRVSYPEALALDLAYVQQCSLRLDCKILLLTIPTLLWARGGG